MDDKFTDVVGGVRGRGAKREPLERSQTSEELLQEIVDQLNDYGALPPDAMYGDGLQALIEQRGFVVMEWLSTDREEPEQRLHGTDREEPEDWQHCGFMLGIARREDQRIFAFIRLREGPDPASPDMGYAQLLTPYLGAVTR